MSWPLGYGDRGLNPAQGIDICPRLSVSEVTRLNGNRSQGLVRKDDADGCAPQLGTCPEGSIIAFNFGICECYAVK